MMYTYELKDILKKELFDEEDKQLGDVYFKDKNGQLFVIDFVEFDSNDNCILSEYHE